MHSEQVEGKGSLCANRLAAEFVTAAKAVKAAYDTVANAVTWLDDNKVTGELQEGLDAMVSLWRDLWQRAGQLELEGDTPAEASLSENDSEPRTTGTALRFQVSRRCLRLLEIKRREDRKVMGGTAAELPEFLSYLLEDWREEWENDLPPAEDDDKPVTFTADVDEETVAVK